MFDPLMILLFLLHMGGLVGLCVLAFRRWKLPVREWPFLVVSAVWSSLVLTGNLAGIGSNLGNPYVYAPLSFLSLGLVLAFFDAAVKRKTASALVRVVPLDLDVPENPKLRRFLFWFLGGTLALFIVISFALGMGVYPDNADSIIYRLPRTFWYVSNGSFLHPFDSVDKRLVFYPINGVALYVPLVLYGLPGTFYSLPSMVSWGVIVYATYRFARELGADRLLGLLAAWLVGLTPSILAQAISTNDEIISAMALLCGLYMGWRWLATGRPLYFFMAGVAVALSAGTKLHLVFLLPSFAILSGIALFFVLRDRSLPAKAWKAVRTPTLLLTLFAMATLFLPFLFYNYASTGRWYFLDDFKNEVFNLSGHLQVGGQNLLIYFAQMFFSPVADLNFWPDAAARQKFNIVLNAVFDPLIRPFIVNDPSYFHMGYRFVGVTLPVSVRFVEFSLWSAFVWLLWPWQAALSLRQKTALRGVLFVLALTPLLWLLLWSFSTLYMEGTATYFTFYLIFAAPASVTVFAAIKRPFLRELRWVVVVFVVLTNLLISHNLVMYSGFRALPDLFYARSLPYDWLHNDKNIVDEIRRAERIRIVFTHEKMPYFAYMHWNPRATFLSPFQADAVRSKEEHEKTLQIFPVSSLHMFGFMPVKVPGKLAAGATYLGLVRAIGTEALFAIGNGVERRHPTESDYLIFRAEVIQSRADKRVALQIRPEVIGFSPHDQLNFEYIVSAGGKELYRRTASPDPAYSVDVVPAMQESQVDITIIVSSRWNKKEIARMTYPFGGGGAWLPEREEY